MLCTDLGGVKSCMRAEISSSESYTVSVLRGRTPAAAPAPRWCCCLPALPAFLRLLAAPARPSARNSVSSTSCCASLWILRISSGVRTLAPPRGKRALEFAVVVAVVAGLVRGGGALADEEEAAAAFFWRLTGASMAVLLLPVPTASALRLRGCRGCLVVVGGIDQADARARERERGESRARGESKKAPPPRRRLRPSSETQPPQPTALSLIPSLSSSSLPHRSRSLDHSLSCVCVCV